MLFVFACLLCCVLCVVCCVLCVVCCVLCVVCVWWVLCVWWVCSGPLRRTPLRRTPLRRTPPPPDPPSAGPPLRRTPPPPDPPSAGPPLRRTPPPPDPPSAGPPLRRNPPPPEPPSAGPPSAGLPSARPPSAGPPFAGPPKISLFFFSSPATVFILFSLSCCSFSLNFGGVFEDRDRQMCTFGLSGRPHQTGPPGLAHDNPRTPNAALQTPPKFHEKDQKRWKNNEKLWREREIRGPTFRSPHFFWVWPPPFGAPP